jgi:hypothetical protein
MQPSHGRTARPVDARGIDGHGRTLYSNRFYLSARTPRARRPEFAAESGIRWSKENDYGGEYLGPSTRGVTG